MNSEIEHVSKIYPEGNRRRSKSLFYVELKRLFQCRMMPVVIVLTLLSPAAGLWFFRTLISTSTSSYVNTVLGIYIANPSLSGGFFGALLFAILTIVESSKVERTHVDTILYSVVSPLKVARVRIFAILTVAGMVQILTMIVWLPYTIYKTGSVFDMENYCLMYLVFMFAEIVIGVLYASAAYQLTRRADLSLMLYVIFAALGLTIFKKDWRLSWARPLVWAVSDDFTNHRILMSVAYMRTFWILLLSGCCCITYLCIREYGKNIFASFGHHLRHICALACGLVLLVGGVLTYQKQPFLDHADPNNFDYDSYDNFAIMEDIICKDMYAQIRPDTRKGTISGNVTYHIENNIEKQQEVTFYARPGYHFQYVRANGKDVTYKENKDDAFNSYTVSVILPKDKNIELSMKYGGFPRDWSIQNSMQGDQEISGEYMCLENYCIAPVPRGILWDYENGTFTLDITVPKKLTVIPFGTENALPIKESSNTKTWQIKQNNPHMIIFAADYVCEEFEAGGVKVQFYYGKKHEKIMRDAKAAKSIEDVMNYCSEHIGKLSFFGTDGVFKLVERRVTGGGYALDGASSLDEVDYTATNLSNQNKGTVPGQIIIHETVHQWWGYGNMFAVEPTALWSSEGLTEYTCYRLTKALYGEEYAEECYIKKWRKMVSSYYDNYYVRHPEYLTCLPSGYQDEIAGSLAEVRQYAEMPLKILKAEQLVGGEDKMDAILQQLFNREMDDENYYLTYEMFLEACGLSKEDLQLE